MRYLAVAGARVAVVAVACCAGLAAQFPVPTTPQDTAPPLDPAAFADRARQPVVEELRRKNLLREGLEIELVGEPAKFPFEHVRLLTTAQVAVWRQDLLYSLCWVFEEREREQSGASCAAVTQSGLPISRDEWRQVSSELGPFRDDALDITRGPERFYPYLPIAEGIFDKELRIFVARLLDHLAHFQWSVFEWRVGGRDERSDFLSDFCSEKIVRQMREIQVSQDMVQLIQEMSNRVAMRQRALREIGALDPGHFTLSKQYLRRVGLEEGTGAKERLVAKEWNEARIKSLPPTAILYVFDVWHLRIRFARIGERLQIVSVGFCTAAPPLNPAAPAARARQRVIQELREENLFLEGLEIELVGEPVMYPSGHVRLHRARGTLRPTPSQADWPPGFVAFAVWRGDQLYAPCLVPLEEESRVECGVGFESGIPLLRDEWRQITAELASFYDDAVDVRRGPERFSPYLPLTQEIFDPETREFSALLLDEFVHDYWTKFEEQEGAFTGSDFLGDCFCPSEQFVQRKRENRLEAECVDNNNTHMQGMNKSLLDDLQKRNRALREIGALEPGHFSLSRPYIRASLEGLLLAKQLNGTRIRSLPAAAVLYVVTGYLGPLRFTRIDNKLQIVSICGELAYPIGPLADGNLDGSGNPCGR